jgi:hypothetical protein
MKTRYNINLNVELATIESAVRAGSMTPMAGSSL